MCVCLVLCRRLQHKIVPFVAVCVRLPCVGILPCLAVQFVLQSCGALWRSRWLVLSSVGCARAATGNWRTTLGRLPREPPGRRSHRPLQGRCCTRLREAGSPRLRRLPREPPGRRSHKPLRGRCSTRSREAGLVPAQHGGRPSADYLRPHSPNFLPDIYVDARQ